MKAVVVRCDRIPMKLTGAYGSEWVETPNLDRLAAEGVVFDSAFVRDLSESDSGSEVFDQVANVRPVVHVVDRALRKRSPFAIVDSDDMTVDSCEALFAKAAAKWDEMAGSDFLMWIDVGLAEADWIPPPEWRNRHREDGDSPMPIYDRASGPIAPTDVERMACGWADRLAYFDSLFGAFVQSIDEGAEEKAAVVFTSESGEPLGEHGVVGVVADDLHRERIQRPLIVRHPSGPRSVRRARIMEAGDVNEMIVELATTGSTTRLDLPDHERWSVVSRGGEQCALSTRLWKFVDRPDGRAGLFALPEDRWEMNDLASRTPGTVDDLQAALKILIDEVRHGAK